MDHNIKQDAIEATDARITECVQELITSNVQYLMQYGVAESTARQFVCERIRDITG